MAFERIELSLAKPKASAGITITAHGKIVVAIRKDIVAKAGFKANGTFSALLGTDDDHGRLQIVKDKDGVAFARELKKTGAFFFSLGMVPAISTTPHKQRPIEARLVEDGIEIDIPPDDGPRLLAPPAKTAEKPARVEKQVVAEKPAPARAAVPPKRTAGAADTVNGVTIDLTLDSETVSFKGSPIEVTTRQAKLVRLLARPRPAPVAVSFLVGALWDGKPTQNSQKQVEQMVSDLQAPLKGIGLDLKLVKGVGYQLKDA
jgi:hypothetical protein